MAEQVARVSELEEWRDERFAEMDAEVEVYGRQRQGLLRRRQRETMQRVPSLSAALERSSDTIILLEGEPGSGKSVALRHVALRLALRVKHHPSEHGIIPIYLNLKNFRPNGNVDASAVLEFVKTSINRANDRYVEIFLEQEFDRGIDEGTWIFLFDSFDEIPAVLGAVDADDIIATYANALYDFLTGMNACRGIIASREFRGPKRISWPKFRVLKLTDRQRKDLIEKLDMSRDSEVRVLTGLATADPAVRQLADNPLFLALLCEHQREIDTFPHSSHIVFENYVAKRFRDDRERLSNRFALTAQSVRIVAEQAAYCMAAQPGLGLSPGRSALLESMKSAGFPVNNQTTIALNALEYLRLARAAEAADGQTDGFTFAHRRFQEYFATCLVMRENFRADPVRLLTDGRWRESAVTLFQTQSDSAIQPLLVRAEHLLTQMTASVAQSEENPVELTSEDSWVSSDDISGTQFDWPAGSLHLIGLLQDGIPSGDHRRSPRVEALVGRLLNEAYSSGQLHDRRWAVEVCLAADQETANNLLRKAFGSGSGWLREAAYTQAGRLTRIPADIRQQMRSILAELSAAGQLRQQRFAVNAQIRRLPNPAPELLLERVFRFAPIVDAFCCVILASFVAVTFGERYLSVAALMALAVYLSFYIDREARSLGQGASYSRGFSSIYGIIETVAGGVFESSALSAISVFMRVTIIIAIGEQLVSSHKGILFISLVLIVITFSLAWGLAANRADKLLESPSIVKIVALPLAWALLPSKTADGAVDIAESILIGLGVLVGFALIAGGIGFLIYLIYHLLGRYGYIIYLVVAAGGFLTGLGFMFSAINHLSSVWHDYRLLRKVDYGAVTFASFAKMLEVVSLFKTPRSLLLFVQEVKRRRIIVENPSALSALRALAAIAQMSPYGLRHGNMRVSDMTISAAAAKLDSDEAAEMHRWRKKINSEAGPPMTQAILDEIGKIVADAELARLVSLPVIANNPDEADGAGGHG